MDSDRGAGPMAKKPKCSSKWQSEWKRYNVSENRKRPSFIHYNICGTDFSVASRGVHHVKHHVDGMKHSETACGMPSQSTCFRKGTFEDQVTTAEIYFSTFIDEHNMMQPITSQNYVKSRFQTAR